MKINLESQELGDYLAEDEIIDYGHPAVRDLAAELLRPDPEQTAAAAFFYVRDQIQHSFDVDRWSAAYRASDVLAAKNSICHGQAHLLAALLRVQQLPTGLVYQQLSVVHALVAVRLPAGWVRLDPRNAASRFATTPETEQLTYPDEAGSPTVFASVPAEIAHCLSRARPGVAGFNYLDAASLPMSEHDDSTSFPP